MAIETAVITGVAKTSTGTISYEKSGFGTPQCAIIFTSRASSSTNPRAGSGMSIGFTDGTRHKLCMVGGDDAVNPSVNGKESDTGILSAMIVGDRTNDFEASFDSWATDGITLDFTTNPAAEPCYLTILLIKGCDNYYVGSESLTTTGVNDITSPGFKGNLLFGATIGAGTEIADYARSMISFGAAHNSSGDVVTQGATAWLLNSGVTPEQSWNVTRNDCCCYDDWDEWKASAESFDSSGFSINTAAVSPANSFFFYMLLDTGDTNGVSVDIVDSPTSTGTWNVEDPGFEPQSVILGLGTTTTVNTDINADPMGFGLSMFDDTNEACVGINVNHAATTTDQQSNWSSTNAVQVYEYSSGHVKMHEGSFTSFDSLGYNMSFPTSVDGTARKWLSVAIASGSSVSPLAVNHLNKLNNG